MKWKKAIVAYINSRTFWTIVVREADHFLNAVTPGQHTRRQWRNKQHINNALSCIWNTRTGLKINPNDLIKHMMHESNTTTVAHHCGEFPSGLLTIIPE